MDSFCIQKFLFVSKHQYQIHSFLKSISAILPKTLHCIVIPIPFCVTDGSQLNWANLNRQLNSLTAGNLQPASSSAEYAISGK